jgi:hypothetical protein
MSIDPNTPEHEGSDAPNQGVSTPEPAEGADDAPAGGAGSPSDD